MIVRAYILLTLTNGKNISYVNANVVDDYGKDGLFYAYDKTALAYQELGLNGKENSTETGLSASTQYYFKVNIDDGGLTEYDITTVTDTTFEAVLALMNAEITGASFAIVNGDVRCTSYGTGDTSIVLGAGTTGTDLFATLTGFTAFETTVDAGKYDDQTGAGKIKGDFDAIVAQLGSTGLLTWPEGGTELIRKNNNGSISDISEIHTVVLKEQIIMAQVVENQVSMFEEIEMIRGIPA